MSVLAAVVTVQVSANLEAGGRPSVPLVEHFFRSSGSSLEAAESHPWISRFDLDVDGDGRKELFLALPGTNTGQDWTVYACPPSGACRSLGVVRFHASCFFYSLPERRLWAYARVTSEKGGWTQYFLGPEGFTEDLGKRPRGGSGFERDLAYAKQWVRTSRPQEGWADMSGILRGEERWVELGTDKRVLEPVHLRVLRVEE